LYNPDNPLIVQSDRSLLLEVDNPRAEACRDRLSIFCDLVKSPEHIHTYRISPLSLWNARAAGMPAEQMEETLLEFAKYDVPGNVLVDLRDYVGRYGRLKLHRRENGLILTADDPILMAVAGPTALAQLFFIAAAFAALTLCYVRSDFSVLNVFAGGSNRRLSSSDSPSRTSPAILRAIRSSSG